jgi:hypothetical protein
MGSIKRADTAKTHTLSDDEFNYLKILNYSLALNVMKDKIISGFLHHLCRLKWNYPDNKNYSFEIDLNDEKNRELKVREVTDDQIPIDKQL